MHLIKHLDKLSKTMIPTLRGGRKSNIRGERNRKSSWRYSTSSTIASSSMRQSNILLREAGS